MMGASREGISNITSWNTAKLTVQVLASNRPDVRGEQNSDHPTVPEHTDELKRLAPPTQTPLRRRESVRGTEQATQTDQSVGCGTGDTGGRNEGGEGHVGRQDGAGDQGGDTPDNDDGVTRLAVVDAGDPAGEGEDTVTGDGEDKARSGDDSNGGVLEMVSTRNTY